MLFVATLGELFVLLVELVAPKPCAIANNRRAAIVAVAESLVILLVSISGAIVCVAVWCVDLNQSRSFSRFVQQIPVDRARTDKLANRALLSWQFYAVKKMGNDDPGMPDRIRIIS